MAKIAEKQLTRGNLKVGHILKTKFIAVSVFSDRMIKWILCICLFSSTTSVHFPPVERENEHRPVARYFAKREDFLFHQLSWQRHG